MSEPGLQEQAKAPRSIACTRCRRRKKRCDHAVPVCGECRKSGTECVQFGSNKSDKFATVPIAYLAKLEARIQQLQGSLHTPGASGSTTVASAPNSAAGDLHSQNRHLREGLGPGPALAYPEASGDDSYPSPFVSSCDDGVSSSRHPAPDASVAQTSPDAGGSDLALLSTSQGGSAAGQGGMAAPASLSAQRMPSIAGSLPSSMSRPTQPTYAFVDGLMMPSKDSMANIGEDWMDQYANMYFQHIQPQWSFLNEHSWHEFFKLWKMHGMHAQLEPPQQFTLRIVIAVGALLCGYSRLDRVHFSHASSVHDGAIRNYFCHVMSHPSALVRTQAALLLLVFYLHGPSPSSLYSTLNLMTMHCGSLMTEHERNESLSGHPSSEGYAEQQLRRHTIMSCHIINEVISSGWTYPESHCFSFLDEKIFEYTTRMRVQKVHYTVFDHLFQLRCIQSKIRHYNRKLKSLDPADPFREWCRTGLKEELNQWKEGISAVGHSQPGSGPLYHNIQSLSKLYDYSVSILMQDQPSTMSVQDLAQLVQACSEACRTFQASQEKDSVYWTWSSLLYQFRVGVMLLYCYWITPLVLRTPVFQAPESLDGIRSCLTTMSRFANKWPEASVFNQSYQCLADAIFSGVQLPDVYRESLLSTSVVSAGSTTYSFPDDLRRKMDGYILGLKLQHVHRAILTLVEEMVYKSSPRDFQFERIDYAAMHLDDMDLFNFEPDFFQ
ncbi:hypothetical protein GQ53DRAFT_804897 [Thozetella sp. PMI_491]|nr:hypothetical protein GQ53DRAFT_804897 [Thozetella sp. PMI_491]